jgi:predicted TIM-barrel fold metal-dependent hydrolase
MPDTGASDIRFAGLTDMQAETYARRTLAPGIKKLDAAAKAAMPKMISTDAHVQEPDDLWKKEMPIRFHEHLPNVSFRGSPPGATDPHLRLIDQDADGVQAEVLFPNNGMALFGIDDVETQEASFKVYNDWIADYCKTSPKRLYGVPCVSVYDIDGAIKEMHRGQDMGLKGAMLWQVPDPRLPFTSPHYDKLWAAAAEAKQPVICHILTGHSYTKTAAGVRGAERIRNAVNKKQDDSANTLFDFIFSGAFDRNPDLRLLLAESEIGWLPFLLQQWDYYFERFRKADSLPINRLPSEIFSEHVFGTFLEDYVGTRAFPWWGDRNCMWSNDYPHFNMTFPHSRENVEHHLNGLDEEKRQRLTRDNAIKLFDLEL